MKRFLRHVAALLAVHTLGLAVLTLLRVAEWAAARGCVLPDYRGRWDWLATSLLRGVWFDNVIACYILLLPLVAVVVAALVGALRGGRGHSAEKWALRLGVVWQQVLFAVAFLISVANIPYYLYFSKNINSSIFEWFEYGGTTLGLVLGEPAYYPPLLGFVAVVGLFVWGSRRVARSVAGPAAAAAFLPAGRGAAWRRAGGILLTGAVAVGATLFGIRGRMGYNPIKVSQAYHCRDPFLNQLGVSPAFSLLTSALDDRRKENRRLHLMDDAEARAAFRSLMGRDVAYTLPADGAASPLSGALLPAEDSMAAAGTSVWHTLTGRPRPDGKPLNVVLILMESMSADLMGGTYAGAVTAPDGRSLTPFLDSLAATGILFDSHYSAGIHTNHGLHATLYSMPALMKRNLMKGSDIPRREGLPTVLQRAGYRTMFFMTHESQYDNMNAYFRTNGYEEIYAQEDYPADSVVNAFGVPDGFLLRYALGVLDEAAGDGERPFFATLLTISNHPPYVVPEGPAYRSADKEWQIVEYADLALRRFFEAAARAPWFDRTVFVLQGDHGKRVGTDGTELPASFNHVPLLVWGAGLPARRVSQWSTQMDVQPTVLSLLGIAAEQEHWGIDLWHERRPCVYYTADNLIAARMRQADARALGLIGDEAEGADDDAAAEWLYLYDPAEGEEYLHGGGIFTASEREAVRAWLHRYVCAMLQTAQAALDPQPLPER